MGSRPQIQRLRHRFQRAFPRILQLAPFVDLDHLVELGDGLGEF